jgi:hypothetical protein
LPSDNPSTSVLRHLEFRLVGEVVDDEQGTVWRWERAITWLPENCITAVSRELVRR